MTKRQPVPEILPIGHKLGHGLEMQRNTLSPEEHTNRGHQVLLPLFHSS